MKITVGLLTVGVLCIGLNAGCVAPEAGVTTPQLTPVSAMPTGSAIYDGRLTQVKSFTDDTANGAVFTNIRETLTADYTLSANFTARTVAGTASNAQWTSTYNRTPTGGSTTSFTDVAQMSGTATGAGTIGTDATGIYFNAPLNGTLTATSATRNGVPTAVSNVMLTGIITVSETVSSYFTGPAANGFSGSATIASVPTGQGTLFSTTETVTGTKR